MRFDPRTSYRTFASARRRLYRSGTPCAGRFRARPFLEALEDRSLPAVLPLPIPGGVPIPNPFGGPDVHHKFPGPADAAGRIGGEPSLITNFMGYIGVVRVQGTGTDNSGNTLLWDADMRFMQGTYRGVGGALDHATFAFI